MKLFIKNQSDLIDQFGHDVAKKIHQNAFNKLRNSLNEHNIPMLIFAEIPGSNSDCLFDFITKKEEAFVYSFSCTAG